MIALTIGARTETRAFDFSFSAAITGSGDLADFPPFIFRLSVHGMECLRKSMAAPSATHKLSRLPRNEDGQTTQLCLRMARA